MKRDDFMNERLAELRERILPSFEASEDDPYAVVMVLKAVKDPEGNYPAERDIFQASATALTQLLLVDDEETQQFLEQWMNGRIRKLMKRVKPSQWDAVLNSEIYHTVGTSGAAEVAVFRPVRLSEQPDVLRKAQMSGLEVKDVSPSKFEDEAPVLTVYADENLQMSTGKLAAQVGHAVQLFLMYGNEYKIEPWLESGASLSVERTDTLPLLDTVDIIVRDAGFTEVPSGSVTVVALFSR